MKGGRPSHVGRCNQRMFRLLLDRSMNFFNQLIVLALAVKSVTHTYIHLSGLYPCGILKRLLQEQHVDSAASTSFNGMLVFLFFWQRGPQRRILPRLALMLLRLLRRDTHRRKKWVTFSSSLQRFIIYQTGEERRRK